MDDIEEKFRKGEISYIEGDTTPRGTKIIHKRKKSVLVKNSGMHRRMNSINANFPVPGHRRTHTDISDPAGNAFAF